MIIIGIKLTENNPLVKQYKENKVFKVWGLTKSVPRGIIKLNNHYGAYNTENSFSYDYGGNYAKIESVTLTGTDFVGWAITDENDYLYLAQNSTIGATMEDGKLKFETPLYLNIKNDYHGE